MVAKSASCAFTILCTGGAREWELRADNEDKRAVWLESLGASPHCTHTGDIKEGAPS